MKHYLFAILMVCAACASDVEPSGPNGAAGGRPEVSVDTKEFVAPSDVGVQAQALTQSYFFINSENGAQINRSNTSWDGLRCMLMKRCTNLSVCTNHDFSCTFNNPTPGNTRCTNGHGETYTTLCGPPGCDVYQVGGGSSPIYTFRYGTDTTYVFRTGTAPGFPFATCKLTNVGARLTLSTSPL